jgi:UTP-glucose-1-phosphate uridylyltransferase
VLIGDENLIQYSAEEAITTDIDTSIFLMGRNKRKIEDNFSAEN